MKTDKLYTLGQYVTANSYIITSYDEQTAETLNSIIEYNKFLSQKLTLDLFVKFIGDSWSKSLYYSFNFWCGNYRLDFSNADFIALEFTKEGVVRNVTTFCDLAEATKGQLNFNEIEL